MNWIGIFTALLASNGAWAFLQKMFFDKKSIRWQNAAMLEIEKVKGDNVQTQSIINQILSNTNIVQQGIGKKRIEAVEEIWSLAAEIREIATPVISFYSVYVEKEYDHIIYSREGLLGNLNRERLIEYLPRAGKNLNECRLYITPSLWKYFHVYNSFLARATLKMIEAKEIGKLVLPWKIDSVLQSGIKELLSDKVYAPSDGLEFQIIVNDMEQMVLEEAHRILSGKASIDEGFENSKTLLRMSANVTKSLLNDDEDDVPAIKFQ